MIATLSSTLTRFASVSGVGFRRLLASLHESRQRQAEQIIARYGDLIDRAAPCRQPETAVPDPAKSEDTKTGRVWSARGATVAHAAGRS